MRSDKWRAMRSKNTALNGLGKSPKVTTKTLTRFEALTRLAALGQEIDQCLGALRD